MREKKVFGAKDYRRESELTDRVSILVLPALRQAYRKSTMLGHCHRRKARSQKPLKGVCVDLKTQMLNYGDTTV